MNKEEMLKQIESDKELSDEQIAKAKALIIKEMSDNELDKVAGGYSSDNVSKKYKIVFNGKDYTFSSYEVALSFCEALGLDPNDIEEVI